MTKAKTAKSEAAEDKDVAPTLSADPTAPVIPDVSVSVEPKVYKTPECFVIKAPGAR